MARQASLSSKVGKGASKDRGPSPKTDLERQLKIQKALYEIADAASAVTDLQLFYRKLHKILGKLLYANNFYVTLYDSATGLLSSPYFADEAGDVAPPPTRIDASNKSLRGFVLLEGKTLHLSAEEIEAGRQSGRFEPMGTPAEDWIGTPLKTGGQVIGALTIQSYKKGIRYTEQDIKLLEFVAQHIAVALTRARATEETRQRNREIAEALEQQTAMSEILNVIASSPTDVQPVFEAIVERAAKLCGGRSATAYHVIDEMIHIAAEYDALSNNARDPVVWTSFSKSMDTPDSESNIASVIRNRVTLHMTDMQTDPRIVPYNRDLAMRWAGGASLCVPLVKDDKGIGAIWVGKYVAEPFTEKQIALVKTFADQAVIAIENVRLFTETQRLLKETEERAAELAVINSVQGGLASKLDMQEIYDLVGDEVRAIFNAQVVMISTYDPETETIEHRYAIERGKRVYAPGYHPIRGFRTQIVQTRKPMLVNTNVAEEAARLRQPTLPGTITPKSWLGVPMIVGEKVTGILSLQNVEQENAFNEVDVRLLETFAASMSIALENARLFGETQHLLKETEDRAAELAIINSVQAGLASKLDMQAIYELIGEKVRDVFNVEVMDIVDYDPTTNLISMPYSYEKGDRSVITPREPYGFRLQVIHSCTPLLISEDFVELALQYNNPLLTGAWPKSALFVPLLVDGKVKSIISIQDLDRENAFSTSDVQLLQTLANAMSVALENARLFDEAQRLLKETEHRAQELATVNTVSAALAGELDLNALIELVGEQVRSVFKADIAFVALLDKENSVINFPYQYGEQADPIPWGQGLTSRIIQSGQPLLINREMDRQRQQMGVTLIGKRAQSFLGVPIFVGGEAIGIVSVQSTDQEGLFTENDQRLLSTIAANVGIALQNARLFNETQRLFWAEQRAHEQAEILRSVAQALNRSLSLTDVLNLVLTEIQKVIPYDSAGIYQVHDNRRVFVTGRGFANLQDLVGVSFEFNQQDDEIGYLISQSLQPLILQDAAEQYPQYFNTGVHAPAQIRGYMAVPIVLNQELIGMITLDKNEPDFYQEQHARLAMTFAAQAATAINNARLFNETQQRSAELAIINSVQEGLASKLEMQEIYELVGDKIREVFDANTVTLATFDLETNLMHPRYAFEKGQRLFIAPIPIPKIWKDFIRRGQPRLVNHNLAEYVRRIDPNVQLLTREMPKSVLAVPLIMSGELHGVISIQSIDHENAFRESDLRLLETLADSMSVALENARLWEQEKMYRKALQRELEIGREIQAGFLPEVLPQIEGWEIAASLMSAREVAGDFYDVFELPDGNIGLVIADVCDKGVGAALFMTLFRSLIRVTATQETFEHTKDVGTPCCIADRLKHAMSLTNNYIAETHGRSGMFATLFFGILEPREGVLTYINGGHEPPLIIRSGTASESLGSTGPAVGAILNGRFKALETHLDPGDMFFAFTDGALEAQNPHNEFFGRQRLLEILERDRGTSHKMIKTIEAQLHQYIDNATQFDDITLLAVRRA